MSENVEKKHFDKLEYGAATLGMLGLATVLLLAMRYIQKNSKDLEKLGIFANQRLFAIYTILWMTDSLLKIGQFICCMIYEKKEEGSVSYYHGYLAFEVFTLLLILGNQSLNLAILRTYLQFSNRLQTYQAELAKA